MSKIRKNILSLRPASRQLWSKKTKERTNVNYILIAELPNQSGTLFASNVNSDLEKHFGPNSSQRLQEIAIKGKKSNESSLLELLLSDNSRIKLPEENFTLLVSCSYYDESGKERMDNLLYFRMPHLVNSPEIKQCYFPDDLKEQAAPALFLLASVFMKGEN